MVLRARAEPRESASGVARLHFEVEDTGVGIPEGQLEGVFEAFAQVPSERPGEGAGLGLAISRGNVELMGGRLSATSAVGEGSRFGFTIDARVVSQQQSERGRRSLVTGIEPGSLAADGSPFRVLVVDDHAERREWLRRLLEQVGFEVAVAENGRQGIELNQSFAPHVIWMDARMPVMRGEDAVRAIRSRGSSGHQPVIVALTASAFDEERAAIMAAGFDDFLHKPAGAEDILETMGRHLGVRYRYEPAGQEGDRPQASGGRGEGAPAPVGSDGLEGVLLVDDEPVNRLLARALLERLGLRVEEAASGEEALSRLSRPRRREGDRIDVVLMDRCRVWTASRRRPGSGRIHCCVGCR